ncbi:MAG: hemerythrin domain-containing protein [Actinomycetota bacterium]|nr:hemerythrin domain-containing protein [Actinomycetota bacterium]
MPDVCDLILDDHEEFRRRFAELDELRGQGGEAALLEPVWGPLAAKLEVHASAEEEIFYPRLMKEGSRAEEETSDAIDDHNEIRDAIRRAGSEATGSDGWWGAVSAARKANSDHMAEEERGALADFRVHAAAEQRQEMGAIWVDYEARHAGGRGVDTTDEDKDAYLSRHR